MKGGRTEVALADVIADARAGFASGTDTPDGLLQVRMNNVSPNGDLDFSKQRRVPADARTARFLLSAGDILFNATNSPELVGKTALFRGYPEPVTFSNHFLRLRVDSRSAVPEFVARWMQFQYGRGVFGTLAQRWVNQATVRRDRLLSLVLSLPPLDEQRRLAQVLEIAAGVCATRRRSLGSASTLRSAIYREMFRERYPSEAAALGEVADIVSGITKGRRANGQSMISVPYLAVSNVQDGYLDMTTVKRIDASPPEVKRYRLVPGDLLLTEGGDPDKLGRGTLWHGDLDPCIHQNHIFRVRARSWDLLDPVFLQAQVASPEARVYFLRAAKQTTGIASINLTQLRALPVRVPPIDVQRLFSTRARAVSCADELRASHLATLDDLFAALQHRAFTGAL